jgi:hypothetical protein
LTAALDAFLAIVISSLISESALFLFWRKSNK